MFAPVKLLYSEVNCEKVDLILSRCTFASSSVLAETTILIETLKPTLEILFSIASIFLGSGAETLPSLGESSASFVLETNLLPALLHLPSEKCWQEICF